MTYENFINIIANSEPSDWIYDDDIGLYVFRNDINITINSDRLDNEDREFHEDWATNFPDSHAVRARFFLKFNGTIISVFYTAAVDGYRCLIPYTEMGTRSITQTKYRIGRILNIPYRDFDEYLQSAGITVIG